MKSQKVKIYIMKNLFLLVSMFLSSQLFPQTSYEDSLKLFLNNYVQNHQVVKGHDKTHIQFYSVDKEYRVEADFKAATKSDWLTFKTSGTKTKIFKLYGTLSFALNGKPYQLNIYESQELMMNEEYRNYLFLPFTDVTNGSETYISGRYLDLSTTDIKSKKVVLDFNKAYNPYCAYVDGVYNCPIPPKENALAVVIKAGEKSFSKSH